MSKFNHEVLFCPQEEKKTNYLSRIFGIFSEEIVEFWLKNDKCPFEGMGRPTIYDLEGNRLATLDFTFRHKKSKKIYIVEQKCFFGFRKGRLACISTNGVFMKEFESWSTKKENDKEAWKAFINFNKELYKVKVKRKEEPSVAGKILIWSSYDNKGKKELMNKYNIYDVISMEKIIDNLVSWNDKQYLDFIARKKKWTSELFSHLS